MRKFMTSSDIGGVRLSAGMIFLTAGIFFTLMLLGEVQWILAKYCPGKLSHSPWYFFAVAFLILGGFGLMVGANRLLFPEMSRRILFKSSLFSYFLTIPVIIGCYFLMRFVVTIVLGPDSGPRLG
jgi:hypothetical protein